MDKGLGFIRTIRLPWLDATAALCAELDAPADIRRRLDALLLAEMSGADARRKTIDVLLGIWLKTVQKAPALRAEALDRFQQMQQVGDRVWLHYGLALVAYPYFRECAALVGQSARAGEMITTANIKQRVTAERGQLGSLKRATERILASLRDWRLLVDAGQRNIYRACYQELAAGDVALELWLLGCALVAHPAEELPFADLIRLPELFPFRFALGIDQLRRDPRFAVQRQGDGWDAVRLVRT